MLSVYYKELFPEDKSFNNMTKDLFFNRQNYIDTFNKLSDSKSKHVFDNIIGFRLSFDLKYILDIHDDEVFVDGGAYIGDTTLKFIRRLGAYKKIYLFEPDKNIINIAKNNLLEYKNIEFINLGISYENCILKFNSTGDMEENILKDGNLSVKVDSLDSCINDRITFLKLDIEGAEIDAINEARKHILSDRPKIAVYVYHKPDHLWKVMIEINNIRDDYKFYIRHYSKNNFDTVLYCL